MRKKILQFPIIFILLSFVSCGDGNETVHTLPTEPHPFATALRDYTSDYDGVVRAYLVTLDDAGTMGVLTTRPTTRLLVHCDYYDETAYQYVSSGTQLFYMQDGELFQIGAEGLFVSGRYNRLVERIHAHTHIVEVIYKLEFGRLEISTYLQYFSDEYLSMTFDGYRDVADEDYGAVVERIAERESRAEYARERYGLVALLPPNFGHMRNTECQTAQILAMTINCVPGLSATVPITQADQISVIIGDIPVNFAVQQPVSVDGHVLVPAHEFFDLLGFLVTEYPYTQRVNLWANAGNINIILNSDVFFISAVDGERSYTLDVPAQTIDGITMVPVAILESAGYDVQWDETTQTVMVANSN